MKNIAIISINRDGFRASLELEKRLNEFNITNFNREKEEKNYKRYSKLDEIMPSLFDFDATVFFLATGIVIRKIAPFLKSKETDPAILVIDFKISKVIPLLSGHLGGANELSEIICKRFDAVNFITTATDQKKILAFDLFAKEHNYKIFNLDKLAKISNSLLNGEKIKIFSYRAIFEKIKRDKFYDENLFEFIDIFKIDRLDEKSVIISPCKVDTENLFLQIQNISIGIGMNRGVSLEEVSNAVDRFIFEHNLNFNQIGSFNSFEAKKNEVALLEYCQKHKIELNFFNETDINSLTQNFSKSKATEFFNIKGVAEPSSILNSIEKELFLNKHIYTNITIASSF